MNAKWEAIERLFQSARERPPGDREAFVREQAYDDDLAQEVLTLLAAEPASAGDEPPPPLDLHGLMDALGDAFLTGKRLGPYIVAELLGEGGMGLVYRGVDERDNSRVAIKILPPGQAGHAGRLERFEREARTMATLHHPAIVNILEAASGAGVHYLVMEYLQGQTLQERLESGPLDESETIECGLAIASALAAAHNEGVTHRDLKPGNVMLTPDGPKVFDFGVAHLDERENPRRTTLEGALSGTVAYMAPEQIDGSAGTAQSDIFALGVLLFEAVTGKPLFQRANPIATARAILRDTPDYRLAPQALRPVLRGCLEKSVRRRYRSADLVHADLEKLKAGIPVVRRSAGFVFRIAGALALAVLALAIGFWISGRIAARPNARALEALQVGQYHFSRRTQAALLKSVESFREAAAIDPGFAPAWGWLANSLAMLPEYGVVDAKNTATGRQAAQRAIALDPQLYIGHLALAWIYFSYDWNWAAAEPEFHKAIALAPNEALPRQRFGLAVITRGRMAEAESELVKAQQMDPLTMAPMLNLAELWFYAHRFDREEAELRKILDRDPGYVVARAMLAEAEVLSGRPKAGIAEMQRLLNLPEGGNWCQQLAQAYAADGQRDAALRQMAACRPDQVPQASTFIYLGQPGRAVQLLEERFRARDTYLLYINVDPGYEALRNDPGFQRLVKKMGL